MTTKITWEQNAMMVAANLIDEDDGGHSIVYCPIPGGHPRFADGATRGRRMDISVDDAPQINTMAEFKRFVKERFG